MNGHMFRSKVDVWIAIIVGGSVAAGLVIAAVILIREPGTESLVASIFLLTTLLGTFAVLLPIRYRIPPDDLVIRSGLIVWRIPLNAILRVFPSSTLEASPAGSLDRLGIEYVQDSQKKKTIYISPEPREEFLEEIAARAGLKPAEKGLLRATPCLHPKRL